MKWRPVKKLVQGAFATLGMLPIAAAVAAFPDRPVTIVVPFAAGGTTDVMARIIQEPLSQYLKQPVVIENRVGAAGVVGTQHVQRAKPDGYTLLMPSNSFGIAPLTNKSAGYSPIKDFAPISLLAVQPLLLTVNPSVPANNLAEFIAYAKANPGKLEYGSNGLGGFTHLISELFCRTAGIEMLHVPYNGQAPNAQALLAGEVKMNLTVTSSQMNGFIDTNRVKLLGVSSPKPTPLAKDVPILADTLPDFSAEIWYGLFAPAGTPAPVIEELGKALKHALGQPEISQKIFNLGAETTTSSADELAARLAKETEDWSALLREANIQIQ